MFEDTNQVIQKKNPKPRRTTYTKSWWEMVQRNTHCLNSSISNYTLRSPSQLTTSWVGSTQFLSLFLSYSASVTGWTREALPVSWCKTNSSLMVTLTCMYCQAQATRCQSTGLKSWANFWSKTLQARTTKCSCQVPPQRGTLMIGAKTLKRISGTSIYWSKTYSSSTKPGIWLKIRRASVRDPRLKPNTLIKKPSRQTSMAMK